MHKIFYSMLVGIITLTFPQIALACSPASVRTESMEPVTIKIGDLYFNIPEKYLSFPYLRAPVEREYIQFRIPNTNILLSPQSNLRPEVTIQILSGDRKGWATDTMQLSNKVTAGTNLLPRIPGQKTDGEISHIKHYLESISRNTPPKTWPNDLKLSTKLQLGKDPCQQWEQSVKANKPPDVVKIPYNELLEASKHRLEAIRQGAISRLNGVDENHRKDATNRIITVLNTDKSEYVRQTAIRVLIEFASLDESLYPKIIEIMLHDNSKVVKRIASNSLSKFNGKIAAKLVEIYKSNPSQNYAEIANALANIVNREIGKNKITSPDALTDEAKIALNGIIEIFSHTSDSSIKDIVFTTMLTSRPAVETQELLAFLRNLQANGNELDVKVATRFLNVVIYARKLKNSVILRSLGHKLRGYNT